MSIRHSLIAVLVLAASCATPSTTPPTTPGKSEQGDASRPRSSTGSTSTEDALDSSTTAPRDSSVTSSPSDSAVPNAPDGQARDANTPDAAPTTTTDGSVAAGTIKIATFNIQVFGKTKAAKPDIMAQLVAIIRKYDVVAIQEIKDITGAVPVLFLDAVNAASGPDYGMLLSPRTGVQADDKASQEQYAVLYDTTVVEALPGDRLYDDSAKDSFPREPYLTQLKVKSGGFSFVLIGIHTQPTGAVAEIGALHDVVEWAKTAFSDEDDFIALGDFNAGCSYASPAQLDSLEFRGAGYFWIVPDSSDSNVAAGSACAYDRIVTTAGTKAQYVGQWGVDKAFTDSAVSDHWPVWAEFGADEQ